VAHTPCQKGDYRLEGLKTDFLLDPIRSDPRFAELVGRWGCCDSQGHPSFAHNASLSIACNQLRIPFPPLLLQVRAS